MGNRIVYIKTKEPLHKSRTVSILNCLSDMLRYIIPGIPPPIGIAGSVLFTSVIIHFVVKSIPETEAAFSNIFQYILVKVLNLDKDSNLDALL